jgi:cyclophilin family peptidyl-prolyl cis-trans isomerase
VSLARRCSLRSMPHPSLRLTVAVLPALLLSACGGGGNEGLRAATGTVTVANTSTVLGRGETAMFTLRGNNLDGITLRASNCTNMQETSRSQQAVTASCLVGPSSTVVAEAVNAQGQSLSSTTRDVFNVTSIATNPTAGNYRYGDQVTFTFTGTNLDKAVVIATTACVDYGTPVKTPTSYTITCRVSKTLGTVGMGKQDSFLVPNPAYGLTIPVSTTAPAVEFELDGTTDTIKIRLSEATPETTVNFLRYVDAGFYDGTVFHRLLPSSALATNGIAISQGGAYTDLNTPGDPTVKAGVRAAIPLETTRTSGLSNRAFTIAMARSDNPDSATSQFFFNTVDNNQFLDFVNANNPGYAVFGEVVNQEGQDLILAIDQDTTNQFDEPSTVTTITQARRITLP